VPDGFVLRPSFTTPTKTWSGGSAFVTELRGEFLVVTALNLLGPNGGLETQLEAPSLPTVLRHVDIRDAFSGRNAGRTTATLLIPEAHVMKDDAKGDVAAFRIARPPPLSIAGGTTTPLVIRPLAEKAPKEGDVVFLAASVVSAPKGQRSFPARVLEVSDAWLFYKFEDPTLDLAGTPGAPILDAEGAIVGMQLGGGMAEDLLVGAACPLGALKARLESGLTNTPVPSP
jgi:hypothetical protein